MSETTEIEPAQPSWVGTAEPEGWRGEGGRFGKGNRMSPGSAALRHAHEINRWFREASSQEHVQKLYTKLYELGMAGDVQAIRVLLERLGGKPSERITLEGDGDGTTIIQVIRTTPGHAANA